MSSAARFDELPCSRPDARELREESQALLAAFESAANAHARADVVRRWDRSQIRYESQRALARIRHCLDTRSEERRADEDAFQELDTEVSELNQRFVTRLLSSPGRAELETELGPQAFAIWDQWLTTFDPAIRSELQAESKLRGRYEELLADTRIEARGEEHSLSSIRRLIGHRMRDLRLDARRAMDAALEAQREELDTLFEELLALRHGMATRLGFDSFTPLAYRRLRRTDYGPDEVAKFRAEVREVVVPLAHRLHSQRAASLGLFDYGFHDEAVRDDARGAPKPCVDAESMLTVTKDVLGDFSPAFAEFFEMMAARGLIDLTSRPGKITGGLLEALPEHGVPFILANFNGTQVDVSVLLHESGHAFQFWSARDQPLRDYFWPSNEACEIPSTGLELLALPYMERFFGADADRFRTGYLEGTVVAMTWDLAVDEFQHRVYAEPSLGPAEWGRLYRDIESAWQPWRRYSAMPYFESGRAWQLYSQVYREPFYGIDYSLALICALQLWCRAQRDRDAALEQYQRLCELGGSLPFTGLLSEVGLDSPFESGTVARVIGEVERFLALD
ncbi:MAG: M3 family oligoendopeptidase [bacterium]|nr:M3 family oligoendopeptidase [bacterium]